MKSVDAAFVAALVGVGVVSVIALHRFIRDWSPSARRFAPLLFILPALVLAGAFRGYAGLKSIAYPVESIWLLSSPRPGFLIETKRQTGTRRVPVQATEFIHISEQGVLIERVLEVSQSEFLKRYSASRIDTEPACEAANAALTAPAMGLAEIHSSRAGCAHQTALIAATGFPLEPTLLDRLLKRTYLRIVILRDGRRHILSLDAPPL